MRAQSLGYAHTQARASGKAEGFLLFRIQGARALSLAVYPRINPALRDLERSYYNRNRSSAKFLRACAFRLSRAKLAPHVSPFRVSHSGAHRYFAVNPRGAGFANFPAHSLPRDNRD